MKRIVQVPRPDWQKKLEDVGFHFHSIDPDGNDCAGQTDKFLYWREDVAYEFTETQVETLYEATKEVHDMSRDLCGELIRRGDLARLGINAIGQELVQASWLRQDPHLYGRFDVSWDGTGAPKFLEYNADTPTSLIESAVAQWHWKEAVRPGTDQFNSIHEALVERLAQIAKDKHIQTLHLAGILESQEDTGNLEYLMDVALQAGLKATLCDMTDIGVSEAGQFLDGTDVEIEMAFKLYPWEWMVSDPYAVNFKKARTQWLEPAWKQVLSNKAFFALLWEKHTGHPNLLATYFDNKKLQHRGFVKKPFLSREGANVQWVNEWGRTELDIEGHYGAEGHVYQELAPVARFPAPETTSWHGPLPFMHAVLGLWVVADEPVGLAVREDISPVTKNSAYFVPHYFVPGT